MLVCVSMCMSGENLPPRRGRRAKLSVALIEVIKMGKWATSCMITDSGRGYYTRGSQYYAAGSDCGCGHSLLLSRKSDPALPDGKYAARYCPHRILVIRVEGLQGGYCNPNTVG